MEQGNYRETLIQENTSRKYFQDALQFKPSVQTTEVKQLRVQFKNRSMNLSREQTQ